LRLRAIALALRAELGIEGYRNPHAYAWGYTLSPLRGCSFPSDQRACFQVPFQPCDHARQATFMII
jgi:hypothetical protein